MISIAKASSSCSKIHIQFDNLEHPEVKCSAHNHGNRFLSFHSGSVKPQHLTPESNPHQVSKLSHIRHTPKQEDQMLMKISFKSPKLCRPDAKAPVFHHSHETLARPRAFGRTFSENRNLYELEKTCYKHYTCTQICDPRQEKEEIT